MNSTTTDITKEKSPYPDVDYTDRGGMNLIDFVSQVAKPYDFQREMQQARRQQKIGAFNDLLTLVGQGVTAGRGARQFAPLQSNASLTGRQQALQDAETQQRLKYRDMLTGAAQQQFLADVNRRNGIEQLMLGRQVKKEEREAAHANALEVLGVKHKHDKELADVRSDTDLKVANINANQKERDRAALADYRRGLLTIRQQRTAGGSGAASGGQPKPFILNGQVYNIPEAPYGQIIVRVFNEMLNQAAAAGKTKLTRQARNIKLGDFKGIEDFVRRNIEDRDLGTRPVELFLELAQLVQPTNAGAVVNEAPAAQGENPFGWAIEGEKKKPRTW